MRVIVVGGGGVVGGSILSGHNIAFNLKLPYQEMYPSRFFVVTTVPDGNQKNARHNTLFWCPNRQNHPLFSKNIRNWQPPVEAFV